MSVVHNPKMSNEERTFIGLYSRGNEYHSLLMESKFLTIIHLPFRRNKTSNHGLKSMLFLIKMVCMHKIYGNNWYPPRYEVSQLNYYLK